MSDAFVQFVSLLAATVRLATPLVLAALGGLFCERAGVIDLGLEGKMLGAAFAAGATAAVTGSAWLGLGAAIIVAILLALVHGYACITHHGNQVVSGMALNILVAGLAPGPGARLVPARRQHAGAQRRRALHRHRPALR